MNNKTEVKVDRLMGIMSILLQNRKITAPELAERLNVSYRTIQRDIALLCQVGIPIVTARDGNGGVSLMDSFRLNKGLITTDELRKLFFSLRGASSKPGISNYEKLITKLAPENDAVISVAENIIINLSSNYKDNLAEKIALLRKAIKEQKKIVFEYYYNRCKIKREVEPYFIEFRNKTWYVFGWCCDRQEFRRFNLNLLMELLITDEAFELRKIPSDEISTNGVLKELYSMELRFNKSAKVRLIEEYGMNSFKETQRGLVMTYNYSYKDSAFSWLLSFGDKVEILSPAEIRDEFLEEVKKLAKKYLI